jgi:hypothetical protein
MSLPGADPSGPLGRALAKLEAVLGTTRWCSTSTSRLPPPT